MTAIKKIKKKKKMKIIELYLQGTHNLVLGIHKVFSVERQIVNVLGFEGH